MVIKKHLSLLLAILLVLGFAGCGNGEENNPSDITEQDELVIYHNNTDLAPMLMAITEKYSAATGKKVSAKLAGTDFIGEIRSQNAGVYVVDTHENLSDWYSNNLFTDFLNDSIFSSLTSKIPTGLQLNANGIGSYGIPLMLEGYGYILDRNMFSDLFGESDVDLLIDDLKKCSYTEFEGFVAAVDTYISAPSAAEITLNGNKYGFSEEKHGRAASLTGVFSLAAESTAPLERLLSTALAAKFKTRYDVMTATDETVSDMEPIISAYMEVLDLHTSHIAGAKGNLQRGDEFVGGDYNYSTAIDIFTKGNALFYPGGTSEIESMELSSEGFGKNLDIIPMKLPLSDSDITAVGMTAEKLQSSIIIGTRYYLAFSPSANETLMNEAREFVNWLYNDETGKSVYTNSFGKVPFNFEYLLNESVSSSESSTSESESFATENEPETVGPMNPSHNIESTLMNSVAHYYAEGNWLPELSVALPAEISEKVLSEKLFDYFGMETWSDDDGKSFRETFLESWSNNLSRENFAEG